MHAVHYILEAATVHPFGAQTPTSSVQAGVHAGAADVLEALEI
jgi:hypothetical protein